MPVFTVTGKLGNGKSLVSVSKIQEYLFRGRPVATNLDIRLHHLVNRDAKKATVYRLPDKPSLYDLESLGVGNKTYDETKNGLIVLDELGTWLNSRGYQDKSRQPIIDWLLHSRKYGWDLILIVQDISIIDKQIRDAICEHVVYCRRMDRMRIPFFSSFFALFGVDLRFPKLHIGVVKYGAEASAIVVEKWMYSGTDLYSAYNTKQVFRNDYSHGLYQYVPPYFTHYRYELPLNFNKIMRLTRIYFKRHARTKLIVWGFLSGFISSSAYAFFTRPEPVPEPVATQSSESNLEAQSNSGISSNFSLARSFDLDKPERIIPKNIVDYNFDMARLEQYHNFANGAQSSLFFTIRFNAEGVVVHSDKLFSLGFRVMEHSMNHVVLIRPDNSIVYIAN